MSRLCMYLPPFSGDYSGVCSSLFDLGGMVCIHDAAGCTGNYTHFDEPRWYGSSSMVYCTRFRRLDAVLGDDEHIVKRILAASSELHPAFIAIVGSPVPNVIGFDFDGVAREVSVRAGVPCFGFATAGIKGSYKDGTVMAVKKLTDFYQKDVKEEEKDPDLVNILGITPLDMDQQNYDSLRALLEGNGLKTQLPVHHYNSMDQIQHIRRASINLAWSQAGLELCQYYAEKYGMPYVIGFPIAEEDKKAYIDQIHACIEKHESSFFVKREIHEESNVCVIADAVIAASQAKLLEERGMHCGCYTVFGKSNGMEKLGVQNLAKEENILQKLKDEKYDWIVADPVLLKFAGDQKCTSIPQHAVSSRVGKDQSWLWTREDAWKKRNLIK